MIDHKDAAVDWRAIDALLRLALEEDVGPGDATTDALVPPDAVAAADFVARVGGVMAGGALIARLFAHLDGQGHIRPGAAAPEASPVRWEQVREDGVFFAPGDRLARVRGPARPILVAERTALNLLQRMCAIAARTRDYVDAVAGTRAAILDTRKTCPGHRALDKWAVRAGGGQNHRLGLHDMIMVKDNHLAIAQSPAGAVRLARESSKLPIMVEVDDFDQLRDALTAEPDYVMLDNMDADRLARAVALTDDICEKKKLRRPSLEASGGVNLTTVARLAASGVDRISVGALTQGVPAVDIGLDFIADAD